VTGPHVLMEPGVVRLVEHRQVHLGQVDQLDVKAPMGDGPVVDPGGHVQQFLDDDRRLQPNDIMEAAATTLLDELAVWESALGSLRDPR